MHNATTVATLRRQLEQFAAQKERKSQKLASNINSEGEQKHTKIQIAIHEQKLRNKQLKEKIAKLKQSKK